MTVPITSDLVGYQQFWQTWLIRLAIVAALVIVELAAILWAIVRK